MGNAARRNAAWLGQPETSPFSLFRFGTTFDSRDQLIAFHERFARNVENAQNRGRGVTSEKLLFPNLLRALLD